MQELRITTIVPLPDGHMAASKVLVAIEPAIEAFTAEIEKHGGNVTHDVVTPKPRAAKEA